MLLFAQQPSQGGFDLGGTICIAVLIGLVAFVIWALIHSSRQHAKVAPKKAERSLGATLTPIIGGGGLLLSMLLINLINAKPGANYGVLLGGIIGALVGTVATAYFTVRSHQRAQDAAQLSEREKREVDESPSTSDPSDPSGPA
jgi:hypothetical protein